MRRTHTNVSPPYDKLSCVESVEGVEKLLLSLENMAEDLENGLFFGVRFWYRTTYMWTMVTFVENGKHIFISVLSVEFSEQQT